MWTAGQDEPPYQYVVGLPHCVFRIFSTRYVTIAVSHNGAFFAWRLSNPTAFFTDFSLWKYENRPVVIYEIWTDECDGLIIDTNAGIFLLHAYSFCVESRLVFSSPQNYTCILSRSSGVLCVFVENESEPRCFNIYEKMAAVPVPPLTHSDISPTHNCARAGCVIRYSHLEVFYGGLGYNENVKGVIQTYRLFKTVSVGADKKYIIRIFSLFWLFAMARHFDPGCLLSEDYLPLDLFLDIARVMDNEPMHRQDKE